MRDNNRQCMREKVAVEGTVGKQAEELKTAKELNIAEKQAIEWKQCRDSG